MKEKISLIFKPFVLAMAGLMIGYTFLHWLLIIKLELFSLKDIVTDFGIPVALTAIVAWLILRPKLKILNLEVKRGNWRDFYTFIVWVILAIPLIVAQHYIVTATGSLTPLTSIKQITNTSPTKYYTVERHYIHKNGIGVHSAFDVSGKGGRDLNMHIYVAVPIFETEQDTSTSQPLAWLGMEYSKTISNRLGDEEKEEMYQEFADESQQDFDAKDVSQFIYLDRIGSSDDKDGYVAAIKENAQYKPNETILVGVNEPFESRNGRKLEWIIGSIVVGSLVWLAMLLIPKIDQQQLDKIRAGHTGKEAQTVIWESIELIKPKEGFFFTPILVLINTVIFLLMMIAGLGFISFRAPDLVNWGANYGPLTKGGDWWRLLTSTFLHGGIMHLLANMVGLLFVGIFLEPLLGRTKYLFAYLLTGVLASVASIWWYDATVSVGASGAIFGLYGIFLAFLLTKVYPADFAKSFLVTTGIFVGYNLLMGLSGGIDNAAHIGGLVSGFILGLMLYPFVKRQLEESELQTTPGDQLGI